MKTFKLVVGTLAANMSKFLFIMAFVHGVFGAVAGNGFLVGFAIGLVIAAMYALLAESWKRSTDELMRMYLRCTRENRSLLKDAGLM